MIPECGAEAAEVLGKFGRIGRRGRVALHEALLKDDDKGRSRLAATDALGRLGAKRQEAAPTLAELLSDADLDMRLHAGKSTAAN